MLLEALLAITALLPGIDAKAQGVRMRIATTAISKLVEPEPNPAVPTFSVTARAVSNWRSEAGAALVPNALARVAQFAETDPAFVARCVKLNNYWCIKQARWSGELGGDAEGHTGFATAADGADAAAQLLRRYYREYARRTSLSIVRRWAPAECGMSQPSVVVRPVAGAVARKAGPQVSSALAPHGIGNTVRARFLARRAPGAAVRRVAVQKPASDGGLRVQPWSARARLAGNPGRASRVPLPPLPPLKSVAGIAAGIDPPSTDAAPKPLASQAPSLRSNRPNPAGARVAARPQRAPSLSSGAANPSALLTPDRLVAESSALPSIAGRFPGGKPYDLPSTLAALRGSMLNLDIPPLLCSSDETRIRNYANRIAGSVGLKAEDDLRLFEADGTPTERLAPVMLAMSSVELGALSASPFLVAAAIARLEKRITGEAASAD